MSTILKALEKASASDERSEALAAAAKGPGFVPLFRVARTVAPSNAALRRAGWISALASPPKEALPFAAVAEQILTQVPAPARVLVCGASAGAGATATSLNLATEIALSGRATALWSEIPREPSSLLRLLGPLCPHGLWDHLCRKMPLHDVILHSRVPGLQLLPARGAQTLPADQPTLEALDAFYEEACEIGGDRYVVVDAPPPLVSRETAALAKRSEMTVFVVAAGTPKALVSEAADALEGAPRTLLILSRAARWLNGRPSGRAEAG